MGNCLRVYILKVPLSASLVHGAEPAGVRRGIGADFEVTVIFRRSFYDRKTIQTHTKSSRHKIFYSISSELICIEPWQG